MGQGKWLFPVPGISKAVPKTLCPVLGSPVQDTDKTLDNPVEGHQECKGSGVQSRLTEFAQPEEGSNCCSQLPSGQSFLGDTTGRTRGNRWKTQQGKLWLDRYSQWGWSNTGAERLENLHPQRQSKLNKMRPWSDFKVRSNFEAGSALRWGGGSIRTRWPLRITPNLIDSDSVL